MLEGNYYTLEIDKWNSSPSLKERSFRNLDPNEVLVMVMCTTIHPADLMFLKGEYGIQKPHYFPIVPGFEGSGEIVKVGDMVDQSLVGKRVGIFANSNKVKPFEGLWAQYYYATVPELIIFNTDASFEKICFTINPLTALGMLDTVKKANATSVLQNGASSSVGGMFHNLCHQNGIQTINIVKDKTSLETLSQRGITHLINQGDSNWEKEVQKLCAQFNTKIAFDCVGGSYTTQLLTNMPSQTILYHYGNLEEKDLSNLHSKDFIFHQKLLAGWWLPVWYNSLSVEEMAYYINFYMSEVQTSDLFTTEVSNKMYSLKDFSNAYSDYTKHMHLGKVIIRPHMPMDV
jgi:NADPH2:quinone reductase